MPLLELTIVILEPSITSDRLVVIPDAVCFITSNTSTLMLSVSLEL